MRYYDVQRNWSKVKAHLQDPVVKAILVENFNRYTFGCWGEEFTSDKVPADFESCDWRLYKGKPGPDPAYWAYVKHAACHWLVNLNLELAQRVVPKYVGQWRIVTSQEHSTTWNGKDLLFDMNFMALGIDPDEAWSAANQPSDHEILAPGEHLQLSFAVHYSTKPDDLDGAALKREMAWIDYVKQRDK